MPASLLALLDDIASVLDDVSVLTKTAATKTAGVLGDDLALNAQQVTGVNADRELPVVWSVAKGSAVNKAILVPVALGLSAVAPWGVTPLLMAGGAFLCFEGFEKLLHAVVKHPPGDEAHAVVELAAAPPDVAAIEKDKIKGAIRTDFVLSAEIVVITLGTVTDAPFGTRVLVLVGLSALMTVGVYGLVAGIVKLDDLGLYLSRRTSGFQRSIGAGILSLAPYLMKTLSVVGTAAMFLVGGGILVHGVHAVAHFIEHFAEGLESVPVLGGVLHGLVPALFNALVGILLGAVVLLLVTVVKRAARGMSRARA